MINPRLALVVLALLSPAMISASEDAKPNSEDDPLNEQHWPAFLQPRSLDVADDEDQLPRLLKQRYNAAQEELRDRYVYWLRDIGTLDHVYAAADRAMKARLAVADPPANLTALLDERLAMARFIEQQVDKLLEQKKRAAKIADQKCARYYRLDAELAVLHSGEQMAKQLGEDSNPSIIYLQDMMAEETVDIVNAVFDDKQNDISIQALEQSNALLVVSSNELFREIQSLTEQLQQPLHQPPDEVVPMILFGKSPEEVRRDLEAIEKGMKASELEHQKRFESPKSKTRPNDSEQ